MIELRTDWTYEMLLMEAKKYTSRSEFNSNSNAYQIAAKRGVLDEICSHMEIHHIKWTDEMIFEEAAKFKSRSEFKELNNLAYVAAQRRNFLDKACDHMEYKNTYWSDDEIAQEAQKYKTRNEFQVSSSAYQIAHKRGILEKVCSHMTYTERVNWTPELLAEEALKYSSRRDFYRKNNNAYVAARRLDILDDITEHLGYLDTYNTRDVVYLWHAEGDIFKVGITSENLGDQRIYDVAKEAGSIPEIVMLKNVGTVMAKKIESQILKLGEPVSFRSKFPGSSEFRHFSSSDLNKAIEIIRAD
jgi:hypothetical protein